MRTLIFGLVVLLAGCESASDKKMDAIIARLDAIEQTLNQKASDLESEIDDVKTDISNIDCGQ